MTIERPSPEELLRRIQAEERKARRGRLKIFLGYVSRVGKSRRMLEEMKRRKTRGQDVVIGWIQPDNSATTHQLLLELEVIPPCLIGDEPEMNVDAILGRKPQICLVDELAHGNPSGCRNEHRWQDVEELLEAGINVVTAVNVQYVEGLQPQIRQLLGAGKTETVPDRIIQEADEVVLVDASPEALRERMDTGAFDTRTLMALRELALLFTADTVDRSVEDYRHEHHIEAIWQTHERILVCITAHHRGPELVDRGRRVAERLKGELYVVYVTPDPEWSNVSAGQRTFIQTTLALARTFHATVEVIESTRPADAIIEYAQTHHITQIFIGHSLKKRFPKLLSQSTVGRIIRQAEGIDVHVASDQPSAKVLDFRLPGLTQPAARPAAAPVLAPPVPLQMPIVKTTPRRERAGRLKVYLGYAAGVGKTYQMLADGNDARARGHDVVIGYFEPHGRADTIAQIGSLEMVPRKKVIYRDKEFEEMDVEAVMARRPEISLVDELAHTNVPGSGHEKRWQDVMQLVDAGMEVWTTVNVQHLESLNDAILQITNVKVRETVPDWVVTEADEVVMIDVATRALLNRLHRGVIYSPEKTAAALENFFREGNLSALREIAMRQTADKIEAELERPSVEDARLTGSLEVLMVCLNDHPSAAALVRRAKRVTDRMHADCWVVYVVQDEQWTGHSAESRKTVEAHLALARTLNLRTEVIVGQKVAPTIVRFARQHGVSQIFLGRSLKSGWKELFSRNIIEQVIREAPDLDIHVVAERLH